MIEFDPKAEHVPVSQISPEQWAKHVASVSVDLGSKPSFGGVAMYGLSPLYGLGCSNHTGTTTYAVPRTSDEVWESVRRAKRQMAVLDESRQLRHLGLGDDDASRQRLAEGLVGRWDRFKERIAAITDGRF